MDTSRQSPSEDPEPQDQPLKKLEGPLKEKATSSARKDEEERTQKETDESLVEDEEPGTFDRVYEHGRQMGF
jgi:hypothetical protein